jgi:hypothetical protein
MLANLVARSVRIASKPVAAVTGFTSGEEVSARNEFIVSELLPILQDFKFEDLGLSCTLQDIVASGTNLWPVPSLQASCHVFVLQ